MAQSGCVFQPRAEPRMVRVSGRVLRIESVVEGGMKHVVSFSGGRTSAYLVNLMEQKRLMEGWDVSYVFMDTGAEHPKTYEFVRNVAANFGIDLVCLRVDINPEMRKASGYKILSLDEIGPDLQPWRAMTEKYGVPYIGGAFCTDRMKLVPFTKYCQENFGEYTTWLGIRADEPNRLSEKQGIRYLAEISDFEKQDVLDWWQTQSFDLDLDEWSGNCVFCMKKSDLKLAAAQRDNPDSYIEFLDMLHSDSVRTGEKAGERAQMYRRKMSLEQIIGQFDGSTGEEIKARMKGGKMIDSGSCSESCEAFGCQLDMFQEAE